MLTYSASPVPATAARTRNAPAAGRIIVRAACLLALACIAGSMAGVSERADSGRAAAVAAITGLEQAAVQADLRSDRSFYEKHLAENWTGGTSFGYWETKPSLLKDMSDPPNHRMTRETIADLTVRVYGDTAIATYRQTYELLEQGQRHSRTVITTDTWVKQNGEWLEVASHSSEAR